MEFPRKTLGTVAAMAALLALPEYFPELAPYQMLNWRMAEDVVALNHSRWLPPPPIPEAVFNARAALPARARPTAPMPVSVGPRGRVQPLSDPSGSLTSFYEAIERVEAGVAGARVRLAHYGDSPTTADLITADIRSLLQQRFGDAGHGFHLIAKPWAWYMHRGVDADSSGWEIEASNLARKKDGLYGYGGVSFRGSAGARARFRLKDAGATRFELAFRRQPNAGTVRVEGCGETIGEVPTTGEAGDDYAALPLPAGCKEVLLRVESGAVRLYGVEFLKAGPGVIYDSLGLNGAYISVLAKFFDEPAWAAQLKHYSPDVVVINYGTNESVFAAFVDKVFERELREAIRRIRVALPGKGILVMSPMDRGERNEAGEIATAPALERLVGIAARVAESEGVAFFNTFEAMGGNGTMAKWYGAQPRLVGADFIHPMPGGARIIGNLLYQAILDGYNRFKTGRRLDSVAKNEPNL
jgi:lysophospholipase L1-like esterase